MDERLIDLIKKFHARRIQQDSEHSTREDSASLGACNCALFHEAFSSFAASNSVTPKAEISGCRPPPLHVPPSLAAPLIDPEPDDWGSHRPNCRFVQPLHVNQSQVKHIVKTTPLATVFLHTPHSSLATEALKWFHRGHVLTDRSQEF